MAAAGALTIDDGGQAVVVTGDMARLVRWLVGKRQFVEDPGEPRRITIHIKPGSTPRAETTSYETIGDCPA